MSYQLVVSLLPGSESKVHDLLLNVLFHQLFYRYIIHYAFIKICLIFVISDSSLEGYIMNISLKSPVQQTTKDPQSLAQTSKMMSEAHSNLTSVKVIYTKTFQKLLERLITFNNDIHSGKRHACGLLVRSGVNPTRL